MIMVSPTSIVGHGGGGGGKRKYTHFNKTSKTASRLDFFLIEDNLCDWPVCKTDISHGYNSDHGYISLNLQGSTIERGKGYC